MKTRRLILAALLILALALSITGLIISSSRDPLSGRWSHPHSKSSIIFHPDGTWVRYASFLDKGTWRAIPGPYYARNPRAATSLHQIIRGQYRIATVYVSAHQLTPDHFQQALAENAIHRTPASARARLYECRLHSKGLSAGGLPATPPASYEISLTLEDKKLRFGGFTYLRDRPETWFTRARAWFRGLFPP